MCLWKKTLVTPRSLFLKDSFRLFSVLQNYSGSQMKTETHFSCFIHFSRSYWTFKDDGGQNPQSSFCPEQRLIWGFRLLSAALRQRSWVSLRVNVLLVQNFLFILWPVQSSSSLKCCLEKRKEGNLTQNLTRYALYLIYSYQLRIYFGTFAQNEDCTTGGGSGSQCEQEECLQQWKTVSMFIHAPDYCFKTDLRNCETIL